MANAAFSIYENSKLHPSFEKIPILNILSQTLEQFEKLEVEKHLKGVTVAIQHIEEKYSNPESYNLVVLNLKKRIVNVRNFKPEQINEANQAYTDCERRIENGEKLDAVLVSTSSLYELKEAYPSYFGDAKEFIKKIEEFKDIIETYYEK